MYKPWPVSIRPAPRSSWKKLIGETNSHTPWNTCYPRDNVGVVTNVWMEVSAPSGNHLTNHYDFWMMEKVLGGIDYAVGIQKSDNNVLGVPRLFVKMEREKQVQQWLGITLLYYKQQQ